MLVAEDLGYSGKDLEMKVPNYHAPGEMLVPTARL
jgi:alcohol oxidase